MSKAKEKQESPLTGLLVNIVIPVCILTFLSKEKFLGPVWALVVAVAFPVSHGLRTFIRDRKADVLAIIGLVSVMLTGVFGILHLPPLWLAIKEGAVPLLIGLVIVGSLKTRFPLIKKLMLTEALFDLDRLHDALREKGNEARFEKRLVGLSWGFAASMFLSGVLSFILARIVVKSDPLTQYEAYINEIGKMTGLSNVVVLIPVMVVMLLVFNSLFNTLTKLTGLELDDVLAEQHRKTKSLEQKDADVSS